MGKHMGADTKAKILVKRAQGLNSSAISKNVERPRQTIEKFLKRYDIRNTLYNNYRANKPRAFDERTERLLCRTALKNRRATARQLKDMLQLTCSTECIRQTLKKNGICARRLLKKPALNKKQKQLRLRWAHDRKNWTIQQWRRILWSDEKKLNLYHSDGKQTVWRRNGEELLEECVQETRKFGGGSVMIWGAIAGNGLRILEPIEGTLTSNQYCLRILENNVSPAFNEYGAQLDFFQEDNDPKHGGQEGHSRRGNGLKIIQTYPE